MLLSIEQKKDWENSTRPELIEKYGISPATIARWSRENNVKPKRKPGSGGKSRPPKAKIECQVCGKWHKNKKYCSRECMYNCDEYLNMLRETDRSYMKTEEYANTLRNPNAPAYKKYAGKVHNLTKWTYEKYKNEINPNNYPRTICGVDGGYQLDHIIPIKFGFENNIPPEVLAEKDNLRMLPWKENLMRNYSKS